jgi:hypothetical protein
VTDFRYVVDRPDPDAEPLRNRMQATVRGYAGDLVACYLDYGIGPKPGTVSLTRMKTGQEFQRRHCARV